MKHRQTHPQYVEGCFGCKVSTIQPVGVYETRRKGYGRGSREAEKKNDAELTYYEDLRAQGIQPAGTTWAKCEEADKKSQEIGMAYDARDPYKHVKAEDFIDG